MIVNLDGHVTRYDGHSKLLSPVKASNSQVSLWNGIARLTKQIFFESTLLERKCGHPSGMADWGGVGVEVEWWRLPPSPSTSCHSMTITVLAASTHSRSSVAERK